MHDTSQTLRQWARFAGLWRTRALRCCGIAERLSWASILLETRTYLAGLVEIPRLSVPETNVVHAA
jgi:hypothetical protein